MSTTQNTHLKFIQGFFRSPAGVGSIIPSSRFMEKQIVSSAQIASASTIVELGPGTGGTTRALLNAMSAESRLICLERDENFAAIVRQIADPRLHVTNSSAESIQDTLQSQGLSTADVVVSGIPFSTMPHAVGVQIIASVQQSLTPGGRFVAYQLRDTVAQLSNPVFGNPVKTDTVWMNIPPMRVYCWRTPSAMPVN